MANLKLRVHLAERDIPKSQIIQAASQSGRFLKEVNRQLSHGFGRSRGAIVKGFVSEAITNIKDRLKDGFEGASTTPGSQSNYSPSIEATGTYIHHLTVTSPPLWPDLADSTIKRKARYKSPGQGKFWLDKDNLSRQVRVLKTPSITYKVKIFPDSIRRQGDKDTRIDFDVTITLGEMPFPFDDMVRRPLISGEYDSDIQAGIAGSMGVKLVTNEYGYSEGSAQSYVPARPWIRQLSAAIGNAMLERLNTNR